MSLLERRRPDCIRRLSIVTERRFGDGLTSAPSTLNSLSNDATQEKAAAVFLSTQRRKRVRKGHVYLQRCCVVFGLSLSAVFCVPQYTHLYYALWVVTFASFFLMLPTVLPTDNDRIKVMLRVSCFNVCVIVLFCFGMAYRNFESHGPWQTSYWLFHGALQLVVFFKLAEANFLPPDRALSTFWRVCSLYFIGIAGVSVVDKIVARKSGFYERSGENETTVVVWNWIITFEEFAIGLLCASKRFKLFVWRHAASYASIRVKHSAEERSLARPSSKSLSEDDESSDAAQPLSAASSSSTQHSFKSESSDGGKRAGDSSPSCTNSRRPFSVRGGQRRRRPPGTSSPSSSRQAVLSPGVLSPAVS
mmetsp:Transcript_954/g.2733  ORF Transcript_954/g.2733 Transcript_954/m.2733 type:complete len:362 (-) Transcript_954:128-1213(-)|eukprot:CAMPEP_0198652646 /NCGR_PEP_ID=MMETSP1467-20131203/6530_1 /TAXON_ID=1462469 /ORGANISM="unid. sp., Strain CCMP2135" /LENGTH=361 /DNA_ID=CAMNT_0044388579 /DNA_START=35 /DNA_END=1120 /DNA_ORIENTATION=+